MNKTTDSFKRLQAVIKDVNGDNRQIIKSLQDQDGANQICRSQDLLFAGIV